MRGLFGIDVKCHTAHTNSLQRDQCQISVSQMIDRKETRFSAGMSVVMKQPWSVVANCSKPI